MILTTLEIKKIIEQTLNDHKDKYITKSVVDCSHAGRVTQILWDVEDMSIIPEEGIKQLDEMWGLGHWSDIEARAIFTDMIKRLEKSKEDVLDIDESLALKGSGGV